MSEDEEEQANELMALTTIFDEGVFFPCTDEQNRIFLASLKLPQPFYIHFCQTSDKEGARPVDDEDTRELNHLPPVVLKYCLPSNYPSVHPPSFTLSCQWLSVDQLSRLCNRLDEIWEENKGFVVLYLWMSFLENEAFEFLNLKSPLDVSKILSKHIGQLPRISDSVTDHHQDSSEQSLTFDPRGIQVITTFDLMCKAILEYNKEECQKEFAKKLITCEVCFQSKFGSQCINFLQCGHVYCKNCMKEYFTIQIKDGNVKGLYCPQDKCESEADPSQVKELVDSELFSRYDHLLLQTSLQTMADVVYCPRPICQSPVILEKGSNMGSCPSCSFVFCILCKLSYHGLSPCRIKENEFRRLKDEYLNANPETKRLLEQRYGRQVLQRAIEETFSSEWLEKFSKQCPRCATYIQKVDGCNKMTCTKCRAYFCWLCMKVLSRSSPYVHFNVPDNDCFNRLFEGLELEDGEQAAMVNDGA